jgi:hypothetical protein
MFARMVVTGLILDPETTPSAALLGPSGIIPRLSRRLTRAQASLHRSQSKARPIWKSRPLPSDVMPAPKRKQTVISEAPFQQAIGHQHVLSAQGRPYLRHSWHRIDMIAVIAFWVTFFLALSGHEATANRHIYIFRALSVLRAGRLLVVTSGTTTILHSLKRAGPLLITVSFFLIFAFALFSIIGVQSFRGSYRRQCVLTDPLNSTNVIELGQLCGGYITESGDVAPFLLLDGDVSDVSPKGYICPMNQVCQVSRGFDRRPSDHRPRTRTPTATRTALIMSLPRSCRSWSSPRVSGRPLARLTVVNTWTPIMYYAMDSDFFASCLYFLVAVIVLNFWLINLLTAVVVNTFKDIRAETKHSAFGADEWVNSP